MPPALSVLPPTTNILDAQQRTRLIRSTRKLGAVLGTTPYLLESDTSFSVLPLEKTTSRTLKRQGSIFTHHQLSSLSLASSSTSTSTTSHRPSPSVSSIVLPQSVAPGTQWPDSLPKTPPGLSNTRRHRSGDRAPQLYLRLNTVPVSPTDDRVVSSLSPTSSIPFPHSPITLIVPDIAEIRRKRMAKLARHLGEGIPAQLVCASESAPKTAMLSPNRLSRRHTRSVHVRCTEVAGVRDNRPPFGQSRQDWVGEWNRPDIKDVQKELRNLKIR